MDVGPRDLPCGPPAGLLHVARRRRPQPARRHNFLPQHARAGAVCLLRRAIAYPKFGHGMLASRHAYCNVCRRGHAQDQGSSSTSVGYFNSDRVHIHAPYACCKLRRAPALLRRANVAPNFNAWSVGRPARKRRACLHRDACAAWFPVFDCFSSTRYLLRSGSAVIALHRTWHHRDGIGGRSATNARRHLHRRVCLPDHRRRA